MTSTTSILSGLLLLLSGAAQADEKSKAAEKKSDEKSMSQRMAAMRLEFMKTSVSKYEILLGKEENAKLSLVPEPLLRFTNPVSRAFIGASMGPPLFSDGNTGPLSE